VRSTGFRLIRLKISDLLEAMTLILDQFVGCMVGLASGDALGAPYEGGPIERLLWKLIGKTKDGHIRWTDDTQMALDLARSLLTDGGVCTKALASRFASNYRWSRGYGPGTAKVLKQIRRGAEWQTASKAVYPEGSYGNGAAMRAPVLALFFTNDEELLLQSARESSIVTHSHPIGIDAATMIAMATCLILHRVDPRELFSRLIATASTPEIRDRLILASSWIDSNACPAAREVAARLGNGVSAQTSCPTAIYIAVRHQHETFEKMIQFTIACRGDVDTIGAMAGALWGASAGSSKLPPIMLESRDEIAGIATLLFNRYQHNANKSGKDARQRAPSPDH
jgi:poly(ADP-ribose) glycohydrolase ARH3